MKINAEKLVNIKQLNVGWHYVTIVKIIDKSATINGITTDYIDVIFHGPNGFIVSRLFNTKEGLEKLILLFRACQIDTPLGYSINTCLLTFQSLVIKVDSFPDKFGNAKTQVVGFHSLKNDSELAVPEGIEIPYEERWTAKEFESIMTIDSKYYYLG
jgi:hypothetical protein